jgi:hypothetical protein
VTFFIDGLQVFCGVGVALSSTVLKPRFGDNVIDLTGWPKSFFSSSALITLAKVIIPFEYLYSELIPCRAVASGVPGLPTPISHVAY